MIQTKLEGKVALFVVATDDPSSCELAAELAQALAVQGVFLVAEATSFSGTNAAAVIAAVGGVLRLIPSCADAAELLSTAAAQAERPVDLLILCGSPVRQDSVVDAFLSQLAPSASRSPSRSGPARILRVGRSGDPLPVAEIRRSAELGCTTNRILVTDPSRAIEPLLFLASRGGGVISGQLLDTRPESGHSLA